MSSVYSRNTQILKIVLARNYSSKKFSKKLLTNLIKNQNSTFRLVSTKPKFSNYLTNGLKYVLTIGFGTGVGLLTGYWIVLNQSKISKEINESGIILDVKNAFKPTKFIEYPESPYINFPLTIHLFQYECCPYCSQIRAYLDYFGFSYQLTEVDSYAKEELTKFTKARQLPILVLEDKINKKRWHLTNATSIISALESVRNDKHINFSTILNQYLPVLKGKSVQSTKNPFKYHVGNSSFNSIEWRKWINNRVIPALQINTIDSWNNLIELFDIISEKSQWKLRYNFPKLHYIYLSHAYNFKKQYSTLLNQLDPENKSNPKEILHKIIREWEERLEDKSFISGTDKPDLADISMFGCVRAYEGCTIFREIIAKHPKFRAWFEKMKLSILKGFHYIDKKSILYLIESLDDNLEDKLANEVEKPSEPVQTQVQSEVQIQEKENKDLIKLENDEKSIFRILTINYLVLVALFTYAAWSSR